MRPTLRRGFFWPFNPSKPLKLKENNQILNPALSLKNPRKNRVDPFTTRQDLSRTRTPVPWESPGNPFGTLATLTLYGSARRSPEASSPPSGYFHATGTFLNSTL
jgi:hypothetical protein